MPLTDYIIRLTLAFVCGALIGLERQLSRKPAGIRTNSLVALGAAVFVVLSAEMVSDHGGDITRIIGQVVTGAGFLCAGLIIHQGATIQGLTTSATIWCS